MKKLCIAGGGFFTLICCLLVGGFQMSYWKNVRVIQNNFNNTVDYNRTYWENSTYYDIQYLNYTFSNEETAADLKAAINETCDLDCQKKGCQWSVIYALSGWILVLMGINAGLLILGGWFYKPRMVGIFCHHFLLIFNLAALIVTHKFRNRDQGKLAAISLMPSKTLSDTEYDTNWTYQDDAEFIDKIWVWQLVTFFLCLITSNFGCFKMCNRTDLRDSQFRSTIAEQQHQQNQMGNDEQDGRLLQA